MRRLILLAGMLAAVCVPAFANEKAAGFCENGNVSVAIPGTQGSGTQKFQRSYPSCTVTVRYAGGAAGFVTTNGTAVTFVSGTKFDPGWTAAIIFINSSQYTVATVNSPTSITLTTTAGVQSSAVAYSIFQNPPATIYSDNSGTIKANPFTAASSGQWFFYAADGRYDVTLSGGGIPSPFTLGDLTLFDGASSAWIQGGNSFGATGTLGTNDAFDLNIINRGVTRIGVTAATTTLTNSGAGGQTLKLNNTNGGSGASTSVNFYKNSVYVGMVGDRGTSSNISLQHSSGAEIILSSGVVSISGPGGGVLTSGGGLTVGGAPGVGVDGVSAGSYAIGASTIIDSSQNISVTGLINAASYLRGAYWRSINTGALVTPPAGELTWGSKVVAGVTQPFVKTSAGVETQLGGGGGGSGTVTSVSTGNFSPLFTASIATPTTTPALSFTASNFAPYSTYIRASDSTGAPAVTTITYVQTKTTDYTSTCAVDFGSLISVANAGAKTVTLPATECNVGWWISIQNTGAGTWTVSRNGLNIDGGTSNPSLVTNAGIVVYSKGPGNGYFTMRGSASSGSGCASVDPSDCILKGSAANTGLNNDAADIAMGLLSAHNVILATNSLQRAMITSGGNVIVGSATSCPGGSLFCVFSGASPNTAQFDSTGGTMQFLLTNSGTAVGTLTAASPSLTINANNASGILQLQTASTNALRVNASQQVLIGETSALSATTKQEINYTAASQTGLLINSSTNTCGGTNSDICNQLSLGTVGTGYTSLNGMSTRGALSHPTLLALYGGAGILTINGTTTTIKHGTSTTTFSPNNGIVPPDFSFGALPNGSVGWVICTSCKNAVQDTFTAGTECQLGTHNAMSYYNGSVNVCF